MKAFFDMMDKEPRKVMILGGSCTSVTDPIASTANYWRIPVVIEFEFYSKLVIFFHNLVRLMIVWVLVVT